MTKHEGALRPPIARSATEAAADTLAATGCPDGVWRTRRLELPSSRRRRPRSGRAETFDPSRVRSACLDSRALPRAHRLGAQSCKRRLHNCRWKARGRRDGGSTRSPGCTDVKALAPAHHGNHRYPKPRCCVASRCGSCRKTMHLLRIRPPTISRTLPHNPRSERGKLVGSCDV